MLLSGIVLWPLAGLILGIALCAVLAGLLALVILLDADETLLELTYKIVLSANVRGEAIHIAAATINKFLFIIFTSYKST